MRFLITTIVCSFFITITHGQWVQKADVPGEARHHPLTFGLNGSGYLLAGSSNSTDLDDMYKYDVASDSWTQMDDFPGGARGFAVAATNGNKAYVGFGSGRINSTLIRFFDLWEFDGESETWKELAPCPCTGRRHPAFLATSEYIYVGMGSDSDDNQNDWWQYEIATDTWSQKKNFPSQRRHHPFYFQIDGVPFVGFGHGASIYNDLYSYDSDTDSWEFRSFIRGGQARVAGTQFDYNGKGYVLSGDGSTHENLLTGEFWEFDPDTDKFSQIIPHPGQGRWAPGSFVIDNTAYIMSGETSELLSTMWGYELEPPASSTEINEHNFEFYPNPTNNILWVKGDSPVNKVEIFNSQGSLIGTEQSDKIQMDAFSQGVYFLRVSTQDGQVFTQRIIRSN